MKTLIMLSMLALLLATGLYAASESTHPVADWGVPGGLAGLGGVIVWAVKKVDATMERHAQANQAHLSKLCEVANESIEESRESAERNRASTEAMDEARRAFIANTHRPRNHLKPGDMGDLAETGT